MAQVVVGRVVRPHGVRGEVIVEVRTDDPDARFRQGAEYDTPKGTLRAETVRWHRGRPMLTFDGVSGREAAEALRGTELMVDLPSEDLAGDDGDEYHDTELIGMRVVDGEGAVVGAVTRVDHGPAYETLVVKRRGAHPALIPFVEEMIDDIDTDAGIIAVELPPGLLDL